MFQGTEWLKTDLHIHVPKTAMNGQYKLDETSQALLLEDKRRKLGGLDKASLTQEEKDKAIEEKFLKELIESDLDIIGLTDYFSVANFEVYASELRKHKKKVFPNVELRLTEDAGRGHINLHLIFSDRVKLETISEMLNRLTCNGSPLGAIPRSEYKNLTVSLNSLKDELERTFPTREESYFVVVPVRGDGLYDPSMNSGNSGRYQNVAKDVARFADALFGNANDLKNIRSIDWTGRLPEKKSLSSIEELRVRIGRPMAVFRGSDAHSFGRLSAYPDDGLHTWVRGLRDFSVLQQTVIEPTSRLEICQRKPGLKQPEHVIKKVTFGNSQYMPDVEFNPGLNSIIGPRSSGKSTLLAHTAYAVNSAKTVEAQKAAIPERGEEEFGPAEGHRWQDVLNSLNVEVEWADGVVTSSSSRQGDKMVHYVPQNFLFQLSSGDRRNIDKLVQKKIAQIPSAKKVFDKICAEHSQCKIGIREAAERFRLAIIKRESVGSKIMEAGDQKALQNEYEEAENALSGISAEGEDPDGRVALQIAEFHKEIEHAATDLEASANSAAGRLESLNAETLWSAIFGGTENDEYLKSIYKRVEPDLVLAVANVTSEVRRLLAEDTLVAEKIRTNLSEYMQRANVVERAKVFSELRGSRLTEASQRYESAKTKLAKYKELQAELESAEKQVNIELDSLVRQYENWVESFEKMRGEFEQQALPTGADSTYMNFVECARDPKKLDHFRDFFLERKQDKEFKELLAKLESVPFASEVLSSMSLKIMTGEAKVAAKHREREDLFLELCEVLIPEPRFGCKFEGDTIGGFSPTSMTAGKRALFALTVLLEDDESPWPLLLDQPEDDLDSRSIFKTIAPFLRKGSLDRQVLMVTHNANLVVGADSDLTIVVNRHSDDYPNGDQNPPLFSSLAGALEEPQGNAKPSSPMFLRRKSIKRHICEVVDGGRDAFEKRQTRYKGVGK
ncbi:TrlF family AAA-like ATPase [Corynebacterium tuberculostearicum]|uniref:TrlF family AAA-like ATPase n=2 Tax=Corynebacterium tuberculostearicum TaxID=38304 RepID=UPI0038CF82F0